MSIKQTIDTNLHLSRVILFFDTWGNLARKKFLFVALVDLPSAFISCAGGHGFPESQGYLKKTVNSPFTET